MSQKGRYYFASDFHLGINARLSSREREKQMVRWFDEIRHDALGIYIVGDLFDFWFEYKTVVPKGYTRVLGKMAELRDAGVPIFFFTGNHDMWVFKYFEEEMDIPTYRAPIVEELYGKKFFIGHGDGLGPGDHGYKFLKKVFANPLCQWLFERLHPNFGVGLANYWSGKSRSLNPEPSKFLGEEREWLVTFAKEELTRQHIDYFIFGHRHLPIDFTLHPHQSRYINLGEWLTFNSYAVFDGQNIELQFFENDNKVIFGNPTKQLTQ